MRRTVRRLHKWIGVIACLFTLIVSSTALALNHKDLWLRGVSQAQSHFDVSQSVAQALDPYDHQHLIASDAHHLYESLDGGYKWEELKLYLPAEHVNNIVFSPQHRDLLWISLRDVGVFSSDDGGYVWDEVLDLPFDPVAGESIQKLSVGHEDSLLIQTRLGQYQYHAGVWSTLIRAQNSQLDVQELIWRLHTGHIASWGIWLYDLSSLALIFLALSGLYLAIRPRKSKLKVSNAHKKNSEKELLQEAS